jgi:Tripartite tricarboxylate transporter TctB family
MTAGEKRAAQAASAPGAPTRRHRIPSGAVADVVLTALLLALFAWALLDAGQWSFRAALFPRIVTGAGVVFCVIKLVQSLAHLRRARSAAVVPDHEPVPAGGTHEDEENEEEDVEYVFATAGRRNWTMALGWVAAFFVLLYVAGLFLTAPVFSLLYLRFGGGQSWKVSAIYAVVIGVVLYVAFEVLLGIATPPGLFLD